MARQEKQKHKLIALARIFELETDENHRLTVPQLAQMLMDRGIPCERKSVYADIDALREMGYDIVLQRGRGGGYWLAHRAFELAELKLLVDAVQSCRFIPQEKTDALIAKLEQLASHYEAVQLQRQVYVAGRPRSQNPQVLYTIDELSGLIHAAVLMRPSKSVMDLEVKSLKKKFKDKRFAAGVNREVILDGCQRLGMELDQVMEECIEGLRERHQELGL